MPPSLETRSAVSPVSPRDVVDAGLCIGCGSCVSNQRDAAMRWDDHGQLKPKGPRDWYAAPSEEFTGICPFSPSAADEDRLAAARFPAAPEYDVRLGRFETAYVGHAADGGFREAGSSGGLVSWVAAELIRTGAVDAVAHVAPADPQADAAFFAYRVSRTEAEIRSGAKSRYYPIELSRVLAEIRRTPGRYAVVGVPCFIKAINLLRQADPVIAERVTHCLGLFCGHMKSAALVESFAWQLGAEMEKVRSVDYRIKNPDRPANWYRAHLGLVDGSAVAQDWWHLADGDWGAGFFQNSACNYCDDVVAETADIAFGDAWVEPYSSDGRGTNVMLVRSPALRDMIARARSEGRLSLEAVDAEFIAQTQAAGLRHRREGLSYRLSWARLRLRPRKRVTPGAAGLPMRRRLVYRTRWWISTLSHRLFSIARRTGRPRVYLGWARAALSFYQGVTWSQGWWGRVADRVERLAGGRPSSP